jgi:DinB superfamily
MTFTADLEAALNDATDARAELIAAVQRLSEPHLERAKRGGWPVHHVIEHAIQHDYYMAMFVAHARGERAAMGDPSCAGQPIDEIVCRMENGRRALLSLIDGIDEDAFYELQKLGHDEFSPLTALENAAAHDREHAQQIASILLS